MMTRKPGKSFRKLVRRGNSVRDSLWGKLTLRHKPHGHVYPDPGDHDLNSNQGQDLMVNQSEPPLGCPASLRRSLVLEKEDDETFGFEIMCNDSPAEDLRVSVSCVNPDSPAEKAGLKPGDVLVSVNDVCITEFPHQHLTDTILNSGLSIRLETVSAVMAKQLELKRRLWELKCRLKEKSTEFYGLCSREEQLTGEKLGNRLLGESQMSLSSSPGDDGSSLRSSGSSGSRLSAWGSADASSLCSALEDLSFRPLAAADPSNGENRHSLTFLDSAHLAHLDVPSPLCLSSSELSTQLSFYRSPAKRRSKQGGGRNRFTRVFSNSQGSVAEEGVKVDV
ncbi:cytohesin-interacting protein-like [Sardina pilchardus]|uniref:cytohesin-interacting protein-like n=1 Tax=Sardina pilchardus TaxID=27697 RepID=UPI002E138C5F